MSGLDNEAMFSGRLFHNLMARGSADELSVKVSPYMRVKHKLLCNLLDVRDGTSR